MRLVSEMRQNFLGRDLPEPGRPAGYAWLIDRFNLAIDPPKVLTAIADRYRPRSTPDWQMMVARQWPGDRVADHLLFAMRYEGVNLSVLERLTHAVPDDDLIEAIAGGSGIYGRRIWFFWEWLSGRDLPMSDAGKVTYVPALDPELHVCLPRGEKSVRHKVIINLPGGRDFCPIVRRTRKINAFLERDLSAEAREVVSGLPQRLVHRAVAFLLLNDSRSSFAIEGETPAAPKAARWARAIGEAGVTPISESELNRLQDIVMGDAKFVRKGIRRQDGFIGRHDRHAGNPIPVHVDARPKDLPSLMAGMAEFEDRALREGLDPIAAAASLAFGFVFIHPFEDGNGRLHRYLIHHILTRAGFNPPGVVFPVSAAIERRIAQYAAVLEATTGPRLELIDWKASPAGNVEVLNETVHLYRYFDATEVTEFLAECVAETIRKDLPDEVAYLSAFDAFRSGLEAFVEMPEQMVALLVRFLAQSDGRLSRRAREKEFAAFSEEEVSRVEQLYAMSWSQGRKAEG